MSMIRTGTIPLSKKNFNKPLSQGGYQSRTKLDWLIEVRYLMPWGCERMCAGQATLGECQTEQKTSEEMRMRALLSRGGIKRIADKHRREAEEKETP